MIAPELRISDADVQARRMPVACRTCRGRAFVDGTACTCDAFGNEPGMRRVRMSWGASARLGAALVAVLRARRMGRV